MDLTASPCYTTNTNKQRQRKRQTDRQRQRQREGETEIETGTIQTQFFKTVNGQKPRQWPRLTSVEKLRRSFFSFFNGLLGATPRDQKTVLDKPAQWAVLENQPLRKCKTIAARNNLRNWLDLFGAPWRHYFRNNDRVSGSTHVF